MACTSPRTVGFRADGKTITWSPKHFSKEYAVFQLPCGKCISCRLDYARTWAIRCVHEAQVHEKNIFLTLTYAPEKLVSPKLVYSDFQNFMKKLRKVQDAPIGVFVTGEYGDIDKRPHWHALLFNYRPSDEKPWRTTETGDRVYRSDSLEKLWPHGFSEFGEVTFESASYCARYAAKKLTHGKDHEHEFQPISKKSSKHAIGKRWLERHWQDIFNYGTVDLGGGRSTTSVPRYYLKWLAKHHPDAFVQYLSDVRPAIVEKSIFQSRQEVKAHNDAIDKRRILGVFEHPISPLESKRAITEYNFKKLQEFLKL